jgi:hypothetical protein
MGKQRITLMLDEEPARLLEELASGPRKKSELVTALLLQAAANTESLAADPMTRIEQRLLRIERNLEQILNRLGDGSSLA